MEQVPLAVEDEIETVIHRAVREGSPGTPMFYGLSGSHLYGFSGGDVDYDVRGFHVTPTRVHASISGADEEIKVNQGTVTDGYEDVPDIDFVSYELDKFASLLRTANYNVIEMLCYGDVAYVEDTELIEFVKEIVKSYMPMDVPEHYRGMAKHNYYRYLQPEKDGYKPTPKKWLYVLRGLLGAIYSAKTGTIYPDVRVLAKKCSEADAGTIRLVDELIEAKEDGVESVGDGLRADAEVEFDRLLDVVEAIEIPEYDRDAYEAELDDFSTTVRANYDPNYVRADD